MKVLVLLACLLGCISIGAALPAAKLNDDVEILPPKPNIYGDQPIIDTGVIGEGSFYSNPFGGFLDGIEGMMARLRQQMEAIFRRFPGIRAGNSSDEAFDFPSFEEGLPVLPNFPSLNPIDLGKGNTTSITKVIDGHKVIINETEYKKEDEFGGSFFKVRIIDVQPDEEGLTTDKNAEGIPTGSDAPQDTESVESSIENEIPKDKEDPSPVPEKLRTA
ncbi:virus-induced RNA 1 [Leptinotarsa decemlineata]|uniref:virus-induced RNA 1 n=1 Tax=Leptinotarsa decemlineata TaxID=7539 RepID=UPI000C252184|nr:icarapin-like [Leptinotarsa decemlineata]